MEARHVGHAAKTTQDKVPSKRTLTSLVIGHLRSLPQPGLHQQCFRTPAGHLARRQSYATGRVSRRINHRVWRTRKKQHVSMWARLPVPSIGCRSANCVGFIEFGRSSSCKHSAGNDLWNIVPQNSILDVNDVELFSTISLGRTCPTVLTHFAWIMPVICYSAFAIGKPFCPFQCPTKPCPEKPDYSSSTFEMV